MLLVPLESIGGSATAEDVATPYLSAPTCARVQPAPKLLLGCWGVVEQHSGMCIIYSPALVPRARAGTPCPAPESWVQQSQKQKGVCCGGLTPLSAE